MSSSRRPPRPGAPARPGSGPARGASGSKPTPRSGSRQSGASTSKPSSTGTARPASTTGKKPTTGGGSGAKAAASSSARRPATRASRPASSRRASGPAPEDRRRSRHGFLLPEVVTVRALVLSVVGLLAVVLLLPTLRAYVNQTGELRELRNDLAQAEAEHDDLEAELARWDDRAYVEREARDRLNFVMPGEKPWRVLDPETVVDDIDPQTGQTITDGPVQGYEAGTPWYEAIWASVQVAGEQPASTASEPEGDEAGAGSGDEAPPTGDEQPGDGSTPASGENG